MAFDALERSRWGGQPIQLFIFQRQGTLWRFANSARDELLGGETFLGNSNITRGALRDSTEALKNNLEIVIPYLVDPTSAEFPNTQELGNLWRPYPPSDRVYVTCLTKHRGDDVAVIEWTGRVVSPKFTGTTLELTCEPTRSNGRRTGVQKRFQRDCWKTLYSQGLGMCNLDPERVPVPATLEAVAGMTVSAEGFAAAPRTLAGGTLTWSVDDVEFEAGIVDHDGEMLTLDDVAGLAVDMEVTGLTLPLWIAGTIDELDGLQVTIPELAGIPGMVGGFITWGAPGGITERRTIRSRTMNTLTLDYGATSLAEGLAVQVYDGCAHDWSACEDKENTVNYGGVPYKPVKNPMSGNPVW